MRALRICLEGLVVWAANVVLRRLGLELAP